MELLYGQHNLSDSQFGYIDMLSNSNKQKFSSLRFATKSFTPPKYMHCQDRHTTEIWKTALKSDRVQWIIQQIVREEKLTEENVRKEAEAILKELAFTNHLTILRMVGFVLYNVLSQIYHDGVFINADAASRIKEMIKHHPVVFMPSHRSYMDFLILSVVCFYLDLPLPAIAAGMDFMGMKVVGSVLRSCGAFYMRRSFGSDRLYWSLFTEYVHTILINGDRPMEFFIEGTRSRSGKSLNPKFGLLSVIAEPYLKAQTYDVLLVPVSISYDRLLEEELYGYELLGIPKPKESTFGLMKASSILHKNYGSVRVHFCEKISMRKYFDHLDRAVHACYPRYMLRLSNEEQKHMEILGYKIILEQQQCMSYTPWAVISVVLSQYPNGILLQDLVAETLCLKTIMMKCKINVNWPKGAIQEIVQENLKKFEHVVELQVSSDSQTGLVKVAGSKKEIYGQRLKSSFLDPSIIEETVNHIIVGNYRNQLLHHFVRPSFVAFSLIKNTSQHKLLTQDNLLQDFNYLQKLFSKEFIFEPTKGNDDFEAGLQFLVLMNAIVKQDQTFILAKDSDRVLSFLRSTFSVFMVGYWLNMQYFLSYSDMFVLQKLPQQVQQWIASNLQSEGIAQEMLSLHMISNAIHAFINNGLLVVHKHKNQKFVTPIQDRFVTSSNQLEKYINIPRLEKAQPDMPALTSAKL